MNQCAGCSFNKELSGRIFGFNEKTKVSGWFCYQCTKSPEMRSAICRKDIGDRICIISQGRGHIHTSQGPIYEEYIQASN